MQSLWLQTHFLYGASYIHVFLLQCISWAFIHNPLKTAYLCLQGIFFPPLYTKKPPRNGSFLVSWAVVLYMESETFSPAGGFSKGRTVLKAAWILQSWCIIGEDWWSFSLCLTAMFLGQLLAEFNDKSLFSALWLTSPVFVYFSVFLHFLISSPTCVSLLSPLSQWEGGTDAILQMLLLAWC